MSDTKIFVCCHGDSSFLPDEYKTGPYLLVGGGGYRSDRVLVSDNTGDNISQYNRYLNEMTVMYWVARNYVNIPDYIGFAMYRHHLECSPYAGEPGKIVCVERHLGRKVGDHYNVHHGPKPLARMIEELGKIMPERRDQFVAYINATNYLYKGNMFIMPKHMFFDYFGFIQYCIEIAIRLVGELDVEHSNEIRACGYLLERMTSFWIWQYVKDGHASLKGVHMKHYSMGRVPLSESSIQQA